MKNKATLWMLLISAALLGIFIFVFERDTETSYQQDLRKRTVFNVYPDSIDTILLERNGVQIECTRTGDQWRLTKPVDAPVDNGVVRKMISGMARVERGELITAETLSERGLSPSDYGFDKPRAKITFRNNRGTFSWLIGRDAPLGDSLYVMSTDSGDIISAPKMLLNLVPEDPAWIRDHTLFNETPAAVRGLDLRRENGGFLQLRRIDGNGWQIQQPVVGDADLQAVHALIEKILSGKIVNFVTDEKADLTVYGLETPAVELTVFTKDEKTQTLQIGKPLPDDAEQRYAKYIGNNSVFTVPSKWAAELNVKTESLRSSQLIDLQAERINAVTLTRGEKQIELVFTNSQWQIIRPARWDADPGRVKELITSLTGASIEQFIDTPDAGQTARMEAARWEIQLSSPEKSCTLRISAPGTNDLRLVQCDDNKSVLVAVSAKTIREDFSDPLFYRNRTVLEVNPAQIEKITVHSGNRKETVLKSDDGSFSSEIKDSRIDSEALTDLIWALNDLQAKQYVTFNPESLDPYGLSHPSTELSVTLEGTNSIGHIVLVGNAADGGVYAMVQGRDTVFILPEKTAKILTRELTGSAKPTTVND